MKIISKKFQTNHLDTFSNYIIFNREVLNNYYYSKPIIPTKNQIRYIYKWFNDNIKQVLIKLYSYHECNDGMSRSPITMYSRQSAEFTSFLYIILNFAMMEYNKYDYTSICVRFNDHKPMLRCLCALRFINIAKGYSKWVDGKLIVKPTVISIVGGYNELKLLIDDVAINHLTKKQLNKYFLNRDREQKIEYLRTKYNTDKAKYNLPQIKNDFYNDQVKFLKSFNSKLLKHKIYIEKEYRNKNTFLLKDTIFRSFITDDINDAYKYGGRYYGHWVQTIKADYRKYVMIDNENTVELDFTSLHPNILYSLSNYNYNHDVYNIHGYKRDNIKIAMCIMLNISSKYENVDKVIMSKINASSKCDKMNILQVRAMMQCIVSTHNIISKYFYKSMWKTAQKIESDIAENILIEFTKLNKPIIPIHDGFIVKHTDDVALRNVMINSFKKILGVDFTPIIL